MVTGVNIIFYTDSEFDSLDLSGMVSLQFLVMCFVCSIFMPPTLKKWGTYWFRLVHMCVCVCVCMRVCGIEISS